MSDAVMPPIVEPDMLDPALVSVIARLPRPSAPKQLVDRILAQVPTTAQESAVVAGRMERGIAPRSLRLGAMAAGGAVVALILTLLVMDLPGWPGPRAAVTRSSKLVATQAAQDSRPAVNLDSAGNAVPTPTGRSTSRPRATAKIPQIRASKVPAPFVVAPAAPEVVANGPPEMAQASLPMTIPADQTTPTYGPPSPNSEDVQFDGTEDADRSPPSSQPEYGFRGHEGP